MCGQPYSLAVCAGIAGGVHIEEAFRLEDVQAARAIVRAHPFATIVTADLRATHMPCLVDEQGEGLAVLAHVACADPVSRALDGPMLMIFQGPHAYVSASWYESETIPTWNHVTLHVRGTPELFADAMAVPRRTVVHFESAVEHPWSLDRMGTTARSWRARRSRPSAMRRCRASTPRRPGGVMQRRSCVRRFA